MSLIMMARTRGGAPSSGGGGGGDAAGISLALPSSFGNVTQNGTTARTVVLTRAGSFSGTVSLTVSGLPSGVTGAFSPSTLSGSTLSSTLTLTASGASLVSNDAFTITASASGVSDATVNATISVATASTSGLPDLASLPTLTSIDRVPHDPSYDATFRAAAAGDSWLDPATGVRIIKLTDATFPVAKPSWTTPYSEGGPFISRAVDGVHTACVFSSSDGFAYIVDAARTGGSTGRVSNGRETNPGQLNLAFSYNPATPLRMYGVYGTKLYAFDASAPRTPLNLPHIPSSGKDFASLMDGHPSLEWLSVTEDDTWLVFQCGGNSKMIAYNTETGVTKSQVWADLNQPQAVRHAGDGWVLAAGNTENKCGVWNYLTDSFTEYNDLYCGHPAPIRGGMVEFNPGGNGRPVNFTFDAATNTRTEQNASPISITAWNNTHKSSQWINGTTQGDTWFISHGGLNPVRPWASGTAQSGTSNTIRLPLSAAGGAADLNNFYNGKFVVIMSGTGAGQTRTITAYDGVTRDATVNTAWSTTPDNTSVVEVSELAWSVDSGSVYKAAIPSYGYGVNTFYGALQGASSTGGPTAYNARLTRAASRAAMTEGTFFSEVGAGNFVYVWANGGVNPQTTVHVFYTYQQDGIKWHRADNSDARLLCHTRAFPAGYYSTPLANISPDGLAVTFTSNMGDKNGRLDVYMALMPETT
jgi:hypothetical protein